MTLTVDCTDQFKLNNLVVVDTDLTARPQIITEKSYNFIWSALKEWESITNETF